MLQFDLSADIRNSFGKGASRSIRREGLTPAVLYGPKTEALALTLDAKSLTKTLVSLQRRNAVFTMEINDGSDTVTRHAIVQELQAEPISGDLVHTDFLEVHLDTPMVFDVPVNYTGVSQGVELGGEMHIPLATVRLKGLILEIPDSIEMDVTGLGIGDKFHCSDLAIPSGSELMNDLDATCVSIVTASKDRLDDEEGEEDEAEGAEGEAAADEGSSEASAS